MKCKECSGGLELINGYYICEFCGTKYLKDEIVPQKQSRENSNEFQIRGGQITSYLGNNQIIVIPDGVVSIGASAFKNNVLIREVVFSKTVNEIKNNAFEGCKNLQKISGYENVQQFGEDCFRLSGLEEINICSNVCSIGKGSFSNMPNLKKVIYKPKKNLKLKNTFYNCSKLDTVETDKCYFFPSFHSSLEVQNNPGNQRPTFADVFVSTPYFKKIKEQYMQSYKEGICPECGGHISKGLFHAKCKNCGIDYKN